MLSIGIWKYVNYILAGGEKNDPSQKAQPNVTAALDKK